MVGRVHSASMTGKGMVRVLGGMGQDYFLRTPQNNSQLGTSVLQVKLQTGTTVPFLLLFFFIL